VIAETAQNRSEFIFADTFDGYQSQIAAGKFFITAAGGY
jgi:hypothetical protein